MGKIPPSKIQEIIMEEYLMACEAFKEPKEGKLKFKVSR